MHQVVLSEDMVEDFLLVAALVAEAEAAEASKIKLNEKHQSSPNFRTLDKCLRDMLRLICDLV